MNNKRKFGSFEISVHIIVECINEDQNIETYLYKIKLY